MHVFYGTVDKYKLRKHVYKISMQEKTFASRLDVCLPS